MPLKPIQNTASDYNLQGMDYFKSLVGTGTPAEKIAAQEWLDKNKGKTTPPSETSAAAPVYNTGSSIGVMSNSDQARIDAMKKINPNITPEQQQAILKSFPLETPTPSELPKEAPAIFTSDKGEAKIGQITSTLTADEQAVKDAKTKAEAEKTKLDTAFTEEQKNAAARLKELDDIRHGVIPLTADEQAMVDGLQASIDRAYKAQETYNKNVEAGTKIFAGMTGQAEFAIPNAVSNLNKTVQTGLDALAKIDMDGKAALAQLRLSMKEKNFNTAVTAFNAYQTIKNDRMIQLQNNLKAAQEAEQELKKAVQEQEKQTYERVTKPIQEISLKVAESPFATPEILKAVSQAKTVDEAIRSAGSALQNATGDVGEYLMYKQDAYSAGTKPMLFTPWLAQKTKLEDTQKANAAYASAYSSAAGKAAGEAAARKLVPGEKSSDPFIQNLLNTAGGKALTDTTIQKLDKGLTVLGQLGVLQSNVQGMNTGPIKGLISSKNPWDTRAQTIKTSLNAIVPNLARGVYGEVGVLTDNDIKTYSNTIPNLTSTEEVRNAVLYITLDMIGKSIKNTLTVNAAAGRDVSGFVNIYTEMENAKNSILSTIPSAQVPKAFEGTDTDKFLQNFSNIGNDTSNLSNEDFFNSID